MICTSWDFIEAQAFRVSSFGILETDLTARVHREKDLNGDACALIKIVMDKNFDFSSPLGIVKRIDKTAEIWLYVPAGTERLTISHPQWGMIRDYKLPMILKGLTTYEMRLEAIKQDENHDETVSQVQKPIKEPVQEKIIVLNNPQSDNNIHVKKDIDKKLNVAKSPASWAFQLISGFSSSATLGARIAYLSSIGFYADYSSNWKSVSGSGLSCDKDGSLTNGKGTPYYEKGSSEQIYTAIGGITLRISKNFHLMAGAGFGEKSLYWKTIDSQNIRNEGYSSKGVTAELGVLVLLKHVSFSVNVQSIQMKTVMPTVGIGFTF